MTSKVLAILFLLVIVSCKSQTDSDLTIISDLPLTLKEASGIEKTQDSEILWMINDGGNKPILYGVNKNGDIIKQIKVKAKNRDWEDLTTDEKGNLYIGNFGNNDNDSKNLSILKIAKNDLDSKEEVTPKIISFSYPDQKKFPPKKNKRHFDCEAFIAYNDSLYLFTKSRSPKDHGKTNLYSLPTKKGDYKANYLSSLTTCKDKGCWVTSADINKSKNKLVLLTEKEVLVFSKFKNTFFFKSEVKQYKFNSTTQKESICFKNDSTLYITDEYQGISGGNLYELKID